MAVKHSRIGPRKFSFSGTNSGIFRQESCCFGAGNPVATDTEEHVLESFHNTCFLVFRRGQNQMVVLRIKYVISELIELHEQVYVVVHLIQSLLYSYDESLLQMSSVA